MPSRPQVEKALRAGGRREQQRTATRREIVMAGRTLFSREGLYDSRIEDITKLAGIAKGTLYLYFRSKEDLVLAVVASAFEELRAHVTERLAGAKSPEEAAAAVFSAHMEFFGQYPDLMRILHQARGVLKFDRPRWRQLGAQLKEHIDSIARAMALGEMEDWSPARRRELAVLLFGSASGTSSVLVATYPSSPLRAWGERWSMPLARGLLEASMGSKRRSRA